MSATHDTFENNSIYRTPRWVKIFGIVALIVILLVVVVLVTGIGGEHGPGRHVPSGNVGGDSPAIEPEVQGDSLGGHIPPVEYGG